MAKPGKKMKRRRKNKRKALGLKRKAEVRKMHRLTLKEVVEDLGLKAKNQ